MRTLYTKEQVIAKVGRTPKRFPPPFAKALGVFLYSREQIEGMDFERYKALWKRQGLISVQAACKELGITDEKYKTFRKYGLLFDPVHKAGNYRNKFFSAEDVKRLAAELEEYNRRFPGQRTLNQLCNLTGDKFNKCQAARFLGMPLITLILWVRKGWVHKPKHRGGGGIKCWTQAELLQIRSEFREYFQERQRKV